MTTAYAWFVRGQLDRSWQANPAGCLFATFTTPLIVWMLACAISAQPVGCRSLTGALMGLVLVGCLLSLACWLIRWTLSPAALTVAESPTPAAVRAISR
jgi:hypothetical protein